ncbi:MAG: hypothetical protein ACFFDP_10335, partial [Promethearchaeota archaeon]
HGGIQDPEAWAAALPLLGAYGLFYLALDRFRTGKTRGGIPLLAPALLLLALGVHLVQLLRPADSSNLFRVDILQTIGVSIAVVCVSGTAAPWASFGGWPGATTPAL